MYFVLTYANNNKRESTYTIYNLNHTIKPITTSVHQNLKKLLQGSMEMKRAVL